MPLVDRLRRTLADPDNPGSIAGRARARRWQTFADTFADIGAMRVLDLGGTVESWRNCPTLPRTLTVVNLDREDASEQLDDTPVTVVEGDACAAAGQFGREQFDLVYSNSLIEHLGGHDRRLEFAAAVTALAPAYWIQTPYRYFPIEPHFLFPGAQFLPMRARATIARRWKFGYTHVEDPSEALAVAQQIELLDIKELRSYFPRADMVIERMAGLPKSIIAVSRERGSAERHS